MNPAFNPPLGTPPVLEWVAPAHLGVDASYQRSTENETSRGLIRKIARFWDWSLCQPLAVTRRDDGSLWVVDGQHRLFAAKMRGDIPHLPCVVSRYASLSDEAAAFVSINQLRKPLGKVDLFRAALAAGDDEAASIGCLVAGAGLTIAPHSNYTAWKPGMLFCVPGIQRAYRSIGGKATATALLLLARGFEGQILQFAGQMLEGLFGIAADEASLAGWDADAMVDALQKRSQSDWVAAATRRRLATGVNRRAAMHDVLREAYGKPAGDIAPRSRPSPAPAPQPAPVVRPAVARARSFEETLALVRAGKLRVEGKPSMARPDDTASYGVVGEINL